MKRYIALLLAICAVLACGCAPAQDPTVPTTEPVVTEPPTDPPTDPPTEPPTEPPTDPPAPYHSPLTGEDLYEEPVNRPYTVILNNYKSAQPIHGISEADIVFESLTEGGMSRCLGVFSDIANVENLGSIRSARKHFVSISISLDAIFVHYGKSDVPGNPLGAQQYMNTTKWNHMDGTSKGYSYFYESKERQQAGYNKGDECHFLVGKRAVDYAKKYKFALTRDKAIDYGWQFDDEYVIVGETANKVTAYFNQSGKPGKSTKYTRFEYDPESGYYLAFQYGKEFIDGNIGEQLAFKNVIIVQTSVKKDPMGTKLMDIAMEGSGKGYYACNGQIVPIKWSREKAEDPISYTLEDGTPVTFGVGKTYVIVSPSKSTVEWQ